MENLVSIIMPCFNGEKYISDSIKSVLAQTYKNWELIIINDCSTDNSVFAIEPFLIDHRITLVQNKKNLGVAETRNAGMEVSKGKFIAFLDCDDKWDPNKLSVQIKFMEDNKYNFTFSSYRIINGEDVVVIPKVDISYQNTDYNSLLKAQIIGCLTVILNVEELGKKKFLKVGHEDFVFWLSYLKEGERAFCLNKVLGSYRIHSNTVSSNKWKALLFTWNVYYKVENLGLFKSLYCLYSQIYQTSKKHLKYKLKK